MFGAESVENASLNAVVVDSPLRVTEIMARNATYAADGSGLYHDYIEIYNSSASDVDISGYHLSDSRDDVMKWAFPEGTVIGAGQYMLVYAPGVQSSGLYADFKLSSEGECVVLSNQRGQMIDIVEYGLSAVDQAYSLDSDGTFKNTLPPTPGMANTQESAALISDRFAARSPPPPRKRSTTGWSCTTRLQRPWISPATAFPTTPARPANGYFLMAL